MKVKIHQTAPANLPPGQQELLELLIEIARNRTPMTKVEMMERLNLAIVAPLDSRFDHLQDRGVITGFISPYTMQAA